MCFSLSICIQLPNFFMFLVHFQFIYVYILSFCFLLRFFPSLPTFSPHSNICSFLLFCSLLFPPFFFFTHQFLPSLCLVNFHSFVCDFSGFNLLLVAIHELGHSLGLWHSKSRNSIMYPRYKYQNPRTFYLGVEDILKIRQLYGLFPLEGWGSGQKTSLENFINFSAPIRTKMFIWNARTLAQNHLTWHFSSFIGGSKTSKQ